MFPHNSDSPTNALSTLLLAPEEVGLCEVGLRKGWCPWAPPGGGGGILV